MRADTGLEKKKHVHRRTEAQLKPSVRRDVDRLRRHAAPGQAPPAHAFGWGNRYGRCDRRGLDSFGHLPMSNLTRRTVVTFEQTAAARDRSPEGQRNPAAEGIP